MPQCRVYSEWMYHYKPDKRLSTGFAPISRGTFPEGFYGRKMGAVQHSGRPLSLTI